MPVRDGAAFLDAALDSLVAQTFEDVEILVVDDGSRDATPALLTRAAARDARIRVLTTPPTGLVPALNRGLAEARAPVVARMDADDLSAPERLARQYAALEGDPGLALVGCAWRMIDAGGRVVRTVHPPTQPEELVAALRRGNCLAHGGVMVRREAVLACGGYRGAFLLAEDYDLWLRLSERFRLVALAETLFDHRLHSDQSTARGLEQRILSELGVHAAADRRARGRPDGLDEAGPIDREALARLGLAPDAISGGIVARALGTARDALATGRPDLVRAATALARREPLRLRTRAHLAWLDLRARLS